MKVAGYIAAFIGGVVACYLLLSLKVVQKLGGIPPLQEEPSLNLPTYLSFISVMMTAVTAVLAAVAIFIGIIAAYTFRELTEKAEKAAQKRADEALADEKITARIDAITLRMRKPNSLDELEEGFDPADAATDRR